MEEILIDLKQKAFIHKILIKQKMLQKPTINASWLGSHDYCEWKWYLENVLKEEVPITKSMVIGKEIHQNKEDRFKEVAIPTTAEEFLKSKFYTITKEIYLKKEFDNFILVGKIDELGVDINCLYVIDDKPKAKPYMGTKRQIWAYCILINGFIKENYPEHLNKKILAVLRNRDSDMEVWKEEFNEYNKKEVLGVIERMLSLFRKEIEPVANTTPGKCRACILHKNNNCEFSCG